jgi:hypothetical protein
MVETKYKSASGPDEIIAKRLRNSGDTKNADHSVVHGTGPTRTHTNIHLSGSAKQHGQPNKGEGSIDGKPRGAA